MAKRIYKAKSKQHSHCWNTEGDLICGCILRDGYILVTKEEQEREAFQKEIKEL